MLGADAETLGLIGVGLLYLGQAVKGLTAVLEKRNQAKVGDECLPGLPGSDCYLETDRDRDEAIHLNVVRLCRKNGIEPSSC